MALQDRLFRLRVGTELQITLMMNGVMSQAHGRTGKTCLFGVTVALLDCTVQAVGGGRKPESENPICQLSR